MIKDIQRNILWKHKFYSKTLTHMLRKLKIDWKNIKHVEIQINSNKNVDNSILYEPHFCNISFINYLKTKWRSFFYDTLCIPGDLCTLRRDASRTMKRRVCTLPVYTPQPSYKIAIRAPRRKGAFLLKINTYIVISENSKSIRLASHQPLFLIYFPRWPTYYWLSSIYACLCPPPSFFFYHIVNRVISSCSFNFVVVYFLSN